MNTVPWALCEDFAWVNFGRAASAPKLLHEKLAADGKGGRRPVRPKSEDNRPRPWARRPP